MRKEMIKILFFASIRELFNQEKIMIDINTLSIQSADDLVDFYSQKEGGPWSELKNRKAKTKVAINQEMREWHTAFKDGDEVAFLPPITGG
jgi:molybdopterin converting factor subunit 1